MGFICQKGIWLTNYFKNKAGGKFGYCVKRASSGPTARHKKRLAEIRLIIPSLFAVADDSPLIPLQGRAEPPLLAEC